MDKQSYGQEFIFHTDLKALQVRPIVAREEEFWDIMMSRYHYSGFRTLVGESLKYIATILEAIKDLDSEFFPSEHVDYDKGHGRIENSLHWVNDKNESSRREDYSIPPLTEQYMQISRTWLFKQVHKEAE
jgi:hypothetical protein